MHTNLPAGYSLRPAAMTDVPAALELVTANDMMEYGEPDYTLEDLESEFADVALETNSWVVVAPDGSLAAYALIFDNGRPRLDGNIYVHPEQRGKGFGTLLTRLVEERARQVAADRGSLELTHHTPVVNKESLLLLGNEGYEVIRYFWRMAIDLKEPAREPVWPEGISVRTFVPGQDDEIAFETVEESFQDHFGWTRGTLEEFQKRTQKPDFDPTLWYLIYEGDEVAAVALCQNYMENGGWVRSLGVRRPWRKRGIGLAALQHIFAEFGRRGKTSVALGVDSESLTGATRLYERAGMKVTRNFARFQKQIIA